MAPTENKPFYIRARVSDEAGEGWSAIRRTEGLNLTALCEALGLAFAAGGKTIDLDQLLRDARRIQGRRYTGE